MPIGFSKAIVTSAGGGGAMPIGQQEYTSPGGYYWTAPAGVTAVSVVAVGG